MRARRGFRTLVLHYLSSKIGNRHRDTLTDYCHPATNLLLASSRSTVGDSSFVISNVTVTFSGPIIYLFTIEMFN